MKNEKDWSSIAKNFDDLQRYIAGEVTDAKIKTQLSQLTNLGKVIEFGCGLGSLTKVLAPNSESILATDISDDMLNIATERLANFGQIGVKKADCYNTHLPAQSYDTVFMANLIHVVAHPDKTLAEAYRLLKPNGKLILVSYTKDGMTFFNVLKMIYRYLKVFGKPPKNGTQFKLDTLTNFVNTHQFKVDDAKLLGNQQIKAMFLVAKKNM